MALHHDATITPTKPEMLAAWVPTQAWCPARAGAVEVIGAFRFDDPEGQVGIETHIVRKNGTVMQVPFTYRSAPVESQVDALVGEMHHSALGNRWVYDGFADPRYLVTMAGTSMTGQGGSDPVVLSEVRER